MNYRYERKQKTLALGVYPAVSLAKARKRRDEVRELLAEGIDPGQAKNEEKQSKARASANTFEIVARAWLFKTAANRADSTQEKSSTWLEKNIFPSNAALRGMGYDNETMTGHGFRAMARAIMDEVMGERVDLIEHQLAHAVKDANGRAYNRTAHLPARRAMMQRWADYLETLRNGAEILPLRSVR